MKFATEQAVQVVKAAISSLKIGNQATLATTGTPVTLASCSLPTPSTTGNENDLFYLELLYDGQFPGMTGDTLQRNGNINQMMWRTRGRERQAYNFSYDYLDRLRSAVYADVNDAGTVTTNNRFNESLTYADARGNIGTLRRQGPLAAGGCTYGQIDNLTYTYYTGMNRLKTITDGSTPMGFKPLAGATDYIYDVNGNPEESGQAMTTDPHKGLTITYNHLNLPKTFNFDGGKIIDILYDAAGNKLKKTIIGSASNYDQDYIGGIEYRTGVREAIYTAEGRVFYTSPTTPRYEYTVKDHLGNARLFFSDVNANGTVDFATEVLQENHYYPFGLNFDGNWKNDAARDNRYQYNGKEWNDDFGLNLNDYGARWYDAAGIVWWSVDPMSDKYLSWSPYNYGLRNPVLYIDPKGMDIYRYDHKTGALVLMEENDDEKDQIGNYKYNRKTKEHELRRGNAKNLVGNIAKGILKDGINFRENNNTIEVNGEGQPTTQQLQDFIVAYSDEVAKVEVSGFGLSDHPNHENISAFLIWEHKKNKKTSAKDANYILNLAIKHKDRGGYKGHSIFVKEHFHTHPKHEEGDGNLNTASDEDRKAASNRRGVQHYILNFRGKFNYNPTEKK